MILRRCPSCHSIRLEGLFTLCKACRVVTWPGRRVRLAPVATLVLERLALAPGYVTTDELVEHVYGGREDGGPLTANNCVYRAVGQIRALMISRGAPVVLESRQGRGYCLSAVFSPPPLTSGVHTVIHVGKARLSAGVIPIGRARGETLAPALFGGASR